MNSLLKLEVPPLSQDQLNLFTTESIQAQQIGHFDPAQTLEKLASTTGRKVIAADLGGSNLTSAQYINEPGGIRIVGETISDTSHQGSNYLKFFETIAQEAETKDLSVGLSIAGPLTGTLLKENVNSPVFAKDLAEHYDSDFANLFHKFTLDNDAIAGLKAGVIAAKKRFPNIANVLYIINGSGLGGALLQGDKVFKMEPGHVAAVPKLNPFNQTNPCGQHGKQHVCLERIVAGKMGIESLYEKITNTKRTGEAISQDYQEGDNLTRDLYNNSAIGTAHIIKGIGNSFNLFNAANATALLFHGGVFHVPGYAERLEQILRTYIHDSIQVLYTKDFSLNTCLDGAAIAALVS